MAPSFEKTQWLAFNEHLQDKCLIDYVFIQLLILTSLLCRYYYIYFVEEEIEAERGSMPRPETCKT